MALAATTLPPGVLPPDVLVRSSDTDVSTGHLSFVCRIFEADVVVRSTVSMEIGRFYKASWTFNFLGQQYTFGATKWMNNGLAGFLQLFLQHEPRDPAVFGRLDLHGNPAVDTEDIIRIIFHAIIDIMRHLAQITKHYQKQLLDYAVWYREHNKQTTTYPEYIQLLTCHNIAHSGFLGGNVDWAVVPLY